VALRRSCPLCPGHRARPVWHDGELRYVRCSDCCVVFSDIDAETYASEQRNVWHDDELAPATIAFYRSARARVHERFLARMKPSGAGRLLDVGCGLGYFVARARESGWDAYGCDAAEGWVKRARALVGEQRIALGAPAPGMLGGLRFELITAWDVLEHVHDPLPFLRAVSALLAPGGAMFIRTPNLAWVYPTYGIRRHLLGEEIELGPLNHVVYYTVATLGRALDAAGLEARAWPVLPPPQVGFANRNPSEAGQTSAVTLVKNVHAGLADRLARLTVGRLVLGADLDVVASRHGEPDVLPPAERV
jgi:2-polyprenyl-3-methyl-5-hydroxy-6-metoxy-1,4-benzoquinol methylase